MAPKAADQPTSTAAGSTDEKGNNIWTLLPSFDPSEDDIREYTDKVRFLEAICPVKDKGMLAPRLAMLCKGTAWGQVKALSPTDLTNPTTGVKLCRVRKRLRSSKPLSNSRRRSTRWSKRMTRPPTVLSTDWKLHFMKSEKKLP